MIEAKPFLSWLGGKQRLLPKLLPRVPQMYEVYFEPFLGGGALFFATKPKQAFLSDRNLHLPQAYIGIRDHVEEVIQEVENHKRQSCKDYFMSIRKQLGTETDLIKVAGLFIYINKTCYYSTYKINKAGDTISTWGNKERPVIYDAEHLRACSRALQGVDISSRDFEDIPIEKGAFYYFDPPYHETKAGYLAEEFKDTDQIRLRDLCVTVDKAGAYFMYSNSNTPFIRELFDGYYIEEIEAPRSMNNKEGYQKVITELVIRNYGRIK